MISYRQRPRAATASDGKPRTGEQGFTLIETSIALVIMMIVGLGAAALFFFASNYTSGANDRQLAMGVAQKRMEWLRDIPFNATTRTLSYAQGGLAATGANGVTETFENGSRRYSVVTNITDLAPDARGRPTLKQITLRVTPLGPRSTLGPVTLTSLRATTVLGTNF